MSTHQSHREEKSSLTQFAWLSIGAAVTTIALKAGAYSFNGVGRSVV
ncbi:MAG: hypothetical protein QM730_24975 [Anaerolineales bacterium]